MARGIDQNNGQSRMFFLGSDDRVYVMDDDYSQWNAEAIHCNVTSAVTSTTIATDGTFASTVTARGDGTFYAAGMNVLVISETEGLPLIKATTLVSVSGSNLTLADSVTVAVGDTVVVGGSIATIRTNYLGFKASETQRIARIGMQYHLDGPSGAISYVQASARTTQNRDSEPASVDAVFTNQDNAASYMLLGQVDQTDRVQDNAFNHGSLQGTNARLEMIVAGDANVRIQDLYAEVQ